jgi:uncharacterized protein
MFDPRDRSQFLNFAGLFEGGLALAALAVGWLVEINPLEHLSWSWRAVGWGVLGTVPTFAVFYLSYRFPVGELRRIREFLSRELAPSLSVLRWYDLILMSVLAGVSEELLFRGLLQPWIGQPWCNVLFGIVHWITPLYALLAFAIGSYLSWTMTVTEPQNLLTPIVTHALHDYLAFLMIVATYRRETVAPSASENAD